MKIMPYILASSLGFSTAVVEGVITAGQFGKTDDLTQQAVYGPIEGAPVEVLNAAEMTTVTGEAIVVVVNDPTGI